MRKSGLYLIGVLLLFQSGCTGFGLINPLTSKPYTMLSEGSRFGRDQITNRYLVASDMIGITGWESNDVLSTLGQPQQIEVTERDVAEDWYFTYYHTYHHMPNAREGTLLVRIYNSKVIDCVSLN